MHTRGHHRLHELIRRKATELPTIIHDVATPSLNKRATTTIIAATSTCTAGDPSPRCELPANATNQTLPILLGAMCPIFIACLVLVYLHRRHTQKLRKEDAMDKTKSMDFGMEFGSGSGGNRSKIPPAHLADGEKSDSRSRRQVSLDLDVASPYLLPAGLHSHDTLQTMGASNDDRYGRPMTAGRDSSIYAHSIRQDDSPDGSRTSMNGGLLSGASPMPMSTPPHPRKPSMPNTSRSVPQIAVPSPAAVKSPVSGLPVNPRAGPSSRESEEQNTSAKEIEVQPPAPQQPTKALPPALTIGSSKQSPQIDIQFDLTESSRPLSNDQSEYGEGPQFRLSMASERSEMEDPIPQAAGRKSLAPGAFEDRRLSIGFRPLPPEGTADENAEERAMRIRSFYKEYFEDTSPAPPMPTQPRHNRQDEHQGEYHDDSVAVYDQETGRFVIPGAKPFAEAPTRRAMTPPPRMPPRFGGPPPRNGSAASGHFMPPGPRPSSSASGRGPPPQRKPMPPPAPLHLLPTPSMLKEDAFASPVIFAPSSRIPGDGTESPGLRGGLRPYSPSVSPHVPLASAFDELSLLPNPHSLRNSSTFTGLDFAPPRKFKNDDAVSDAGSIRSNNSGVTAQQIQNIRNGAYRVSRIPQDVVPAKEAISSNLKPTWDMRK